MGNPVKNTGNAEKINPTINKTTATIYLIYDASFYFTHSYAITPELKAIPKVILSKGRFKGSNKTNTTTIITKINSRENFF